MKRKKLLFFIPLLIIGGGIVISLWVTDMKLSSKKDEYREKVAEMRKKNRSLEIERDRLREEDFETIRREAIRLGFIKKEERLIKFLKREAK